VVSCDGPGDCDAAGSATGPPQPYSPNGPAWEAVAQEKRGVWGEASETPGLASLVATQDDATITVTALSCGSPGSCAVAGYYMPYGPVPIVWYAFLATEKNGKWGKAANVPGLEALDDGLEDQINAISCTAAGDCTAAGFVTPEPFLAPNGGEQDGFVIDERNGTWDKARLVPGITVKLGLSAQAQALSCSSPGNCVVGGYVSNDLSQTPPSVAFVAAEKDGVWHRATLIPAMTSVTSLSCPAAGDCAAAGRGPSPRRLPRCPAGRRVTAWPAAAPALTTGLARATSRRSCSRRGTAPGAQTTPFRVRPPLTAAAAPP